MFYTVCAVLLVLIIFTIGYFISVYNKMIAFKNYYKEAFATMDVYLKKRWDLIPNLVETVKGYKDFEGETLEKITAMRNINYSGLKQSEKVDLNQKLSFGLSSLIATVENYPELKSSETFMNLMNELSKIEEDIANSRKYYNATVREFNTYIALFPPCIVASTFNFKEEKLFEISENEKENVKVKF